MLYVTNLGDSQILVIRPNDEEVIYKTTEQWHWFDCPRQLGTNSPDTPISNAVMDKVGLEVNDVVLAMSDGVTDNLWEHEVVQNVVSSIRKWESGDGGDIKGDRTGGASGGMLYVAEELMKAAKVIAQDPYAESPFMERAVEEGLAMEGGLYWLLHGDGSSTNREQASWMISVSWLHFAGEGKDEITDENSGAPKLQGRQEPVFPGGFFVTFNSNVDGNLLKNREMTRSRVRIQVRV